jgi:hypothetical protein
MVQAQQLGLILGKENLFKVWNLFLVIFFILSRNLEDFLC